jgi:hypothetical protein
MECAPVECPDTFALEYIHHECFEWGPAKNVTVEPPDCCPEYVCVNDGTCQYKGRKFANFDVIPIELTGCDQKCECEFGTVSCTRMCPLISATPPPSLPCPPHLAQLMTNPENKCCKIWRCQREETTTRKGSRPFNQTSSAFYFRFHHKFISFFFLIDIVIFIT